MPRFASDFVVDSRPLFRQPVIATVPWQDQYSKRRETLHAHEDFRLAYANDDASNLIDVFLGYSKGYLDPPIRLRFRKLRDFMLQPCISRLSTLSTNNPSDTRVILLDDRCDRTGGRATTRNWTVDEYMRYPPIGEVANSKAFDIAAFLQKMHAKRCQTGAEKRIIYVADIWPACMLALAMTVAPRNANSLRQMLQHHLISRPVFTISPVRYGLEFHIPFFALRDDLDVKDYRHATSTVPRPLRHSRLLPLCRSLGERSLRYHEAVVSFMVLGVDEWFWTAYCCVDTYFGSEVEHRDYLDDSRKGADPPSGGAKPLKFPVWNPREYFLLVLSRRLRQVSHEWTELVQTFDERLLAYEEKTLQELIVEDPKLLRTQELTLAVSTIRRFKDSLLGVITRWNNFENEQIHHFDISNISHVLNEHWESYLAECREHISQLDYLFMILSQRLDAYNSLGDRLVNASALRESGAATRQGEYIRRLTIITVLYLPLSLATAAFSMSMLSGSNRFNWIYYSIVAVVVTTLTAVGAFYPMIKESLLAQWPAK